MQGSPQQTSRRWWKADQGPGEVAVGLAARAAGEGQPLGSKTGPWRERPRVGLGLGVRAGTGW